MTTISVVMFCVIFPPHAQIPTTGPYRVAVLKYSWNDNQDKVLNSSRDYAPARFFTKSLNKNRATNIAKSRIVNAQIYYPEDLSINKKYPLILFSHGGLSIETSNISLFRELASQGYIVCSIGHPSHALWTQSSNGKLTFIDFNYLKEILSENAKKNPAQSLEFYRKWLLLRLNDFNLVLDSIIEHAKTTNEFPFFAIDTTRIGVGGHSLGGSAALAFSRARKEITAVIALESPYLDDIQTVEYGKFIFREPNESVPTLNIYSDGTWQKFDRLPQYFQNERLLTKQYEFVENVYLPGAGHFSLTDLLLTSPLLTWLLEGRIHTTASATEYLQKMNFFCLTFFN